MEIGFFEGFFFCGVEVFHIVMPSLICAKANGGRNSGFELSVLIRHIDLMDPHAWNARIPLSGALGSRQPMLDGTERHRKSSVNSNARN